MFVEQVSVFLENRTGRMAELTSILAEAGIDTIALSVADTHDFGVVRIITDDNVAALELLRKNGFTATVNKLIGVSVDDRPGGLALVLGLLKDNGIDVEYLYSFSRISGNRAVILLKVAEPDKALKIFAEHKIKLVDGNF